MHDFCTAELALAGIARPHERTGTRMLPETDGTPDGDFPVIEFTDDSDRAWEVREIRFPILPERRKYLLRTEYSAGWLLFMCGQERRRLAPYPAGWHLADAARLRCWVNDALPVPHLREELASPPASTRAAENVRNR